MIGHVEGEGRMGGEERGWTAEGMRGGGDGRWNWKTQAERRRGRQKEKGTEGGEVDC